MKKLFAILITCLLLTGVPCNAGPRKGLSLDSGWLFRLNGEGRWSRVDLPHDWSISHDFSQDAPAGVSGGALPGGKAVYKKDLHIDSVPDNGRLFLHFDGIYRNSTVFVNGFKTGGRHYGYLPVHIDITPFVKAGNNKIKVEVDNSEQPNSRWYTGSGINRHAYLIETSEIYIPDSGVYVRPVADGHKGDLKIFTEIVNGSASDKRVTVVSRVFSPAGNTIRTFSSSAVIGKGKSGTVVSGGDIKDIRLWDVDDPVLYSVRTEIICNGIVEDDMETRFGFRYFRFDPQKGFFLNGRHLQIRGVCLHNGLGVLGSAVNRRAIEKRLQVLKAMGCNAVRCSHNPYDPQWFNLCDSMGVMVMDEPFDVWRKKKTIYDYSCCFDKYYSRDLTDFVKRDRNHPSIIMWSIGNEVLEQWTDVNADTLNAEQANIILNRGKDVSQLASAKDSLSFNSELALKLTSIIKHLDDTRPVTAGCNEPRPANHLFRAGCLDVIGYNYHDGYLDSVPSFFPGKPFIFTETTSALMTRGYYKMPSDSIYIWPSKLNEPEDSKSNMCSSYDNCHVPWGTTHEQMLTDMDKYELISGIFVWTGYDYLGEPTPYDWPSRSSYFGIVDLAGIPKDVYYLYKSEWTDSTVIYLFPHWNWTSGERIDMWAYYNNADEAELYINGKSQGISRKTPGRLHAQWNVRFVPGTVTCITRKNGKEVGRFSRTTAGKPYRLKVYADRDTITSDGRDLCFVTVTAVDKKGNECPFADNKVSCRVTGPFTIEGIDNGSEIEHHSLKNPSSDLMFGKCVITVRSLAKAGKGTLYVKGDDILNINLNLTSKPKD